MTNYLNIFKLREKDQLQSIFISLGIVVDTCNSSTWEAEVRGLKVPNQSGQHAKTLYQKYTCIFSL
jgi:hypothetical protein